VVSVHRQRLESLRLPDVSGEYASVALRETRNDSAMVANALSQLLQTRARVLAKLHEFIEGTYNELRFGDIQASLFDDVRLRIDGLLAPVSERSLQQIDVIDRRLAEDDPDSVSQALFTCRRLLEGVADAVFPPQGDVSVDGRTIHLSASHHQNRLNQYIAERCDSSSRRNRLGRGLKDLFERVQAGVHHDVSPEEARHLFLWTYIYLGEILGLDGGDPVTSE
ncbi:MAG TPA: hypothetical protein VK507_08700, partial [Iamia sp.]|nr:hypothetical protein [Iamia sp.]